jgi:subtilase family serine protease
MQSPRLRRLLALAIGALTCAALLGAGSAVGASGRSPLGGTKPSWTAKAPKAGNVSDLQQVGAKVWLAPRNAAQLAALAKAVSDPSSSQYGQFLTEAQYAAQFAPTASQVAAVKQWLTGAGLTVTATGPDNHYVVVSGSADAVNKAFGTTLAKYTINGKEWQAPSTELSVPASLAGVVQSVSGLTQFGHMIKPSDLGAPPAFVNSTQCSGYYGQLMASDKPAFNGHTLPYAPCGYTPSQLRGAYGVNVPGRDSELGRGATVAITDAFDASVLQQDANTYAERHGDKKFSPNQFQDLSVAEGASSDPNPISACGGNGWYGEQTLDIEAVHSMAPGANVLYYGAASCYDDDLLASLSRVVADNKASVVTNSWGEPTFVNIGGTIYSTIDDSLIAAYESVFQQGAVQGIGFYFSSGDSGDELDNTGVLHPDWPAEDPWVTSVGGTSLAVNSANQRQFETGWGTARWGLSSDNSSWVSQVPFLYGAGGGFTYLPEFDFTLFGRPWYQDGVVSSSTPGRAVPDISADADPTTGMLVGETQDFSLPSRFGPAGVHYGEYRIGGTSLASPLIAGMQAVAQGHQRIGFANPLIYSLANQGVYYDVTPQGDAGNVRSDFVNGQNADNGLRYTVRTFNQDSSLTTGPGWDDVSGVGSPTRAYFSLFQNRYH